MGEATCFIKARFESDEAARKALPGIKRFLSESYEAQDWWQNHRDMERDGKRAEFWEQFKAKFPLTTKFLESFQAGCGGGEHCLIGGDCNNDLAGFIDFGSSEGDLRHADVQGDTFLYCATVWHFARWDPFEQFLCKEFGAVASGWLSDEHLEPFDCINMTETEFEESPSTPDAA